MIRVTVDNSPTLCVVDETTGRRIFLDDMEGTGLSPGGSTVASATLLNSAMAEVLKDFLPAQIQWKTSWRLVYSPRLHGVSLKTFYRRMQKEGPSLLLIQDHRGYVFGGFASMSWRQGDRYYGTGESFVFRFRTPMSKPVVSLARQLQASEKDSKTGVAAPDLAQEAVDEALKLLDAWSTKVKREAQRSDREALRKHKVTSVTEALDALLEENPGDAASVADDAVEDFGLEVFHHSKAKDAFFLFSDAECIAMGGGSGFALYLEKDLLHGHSDPCSTFQSEVLSCDSNFIIGDLECWAFDDPTEVTK